MQQGINESKQAIARKLLAMGQDITFVAQATELSVQEVRALQLNDTEV